MYCFCIMFIDFIFLVLILLFQESFLNEGHSLKYVIIILTSFFIIMSFLLFCIKKTILSNILMFTYEGGSGLYLLISVFFQVKEMITNNNNRYKKEYRDNNYQTIVLISSIATIFLKIFSYYNLKEYCKMVDKRETFIRNNQHEETHSYSHCSCTDARFLRLRRQSRSRLRQGRSGRSGKCGR